MITYPQYLDEMILEAAAQQDGAELEGVSLAEIHERRFIDCPLTWLYSASSALANAGYGVDWQDTANVTFRLNGNGLLRAQSIRDERTDKKLVPRIRKTLAKDWLAILALGVSVLALFRTGN